MSDNSIIATAFVLGVLAGELLQPLQWKLAVLAWRALRRKYNR